MWPAGPAGPAGPGSGAGSAPGSAPGSGPGAGPGPGAVGPGCGAGSRLPWARESALRRAAFCGNLSALPPHLVPAGRSVRVFISANPEDTGAERQALRENVYPKLREFCRENYGLEFQGLLGEKYGNIRIPGEVEASEFEMILDAAVEAKLETKLLEEWYCRDENSVPATYYLRPKAEMLKIHAKTVDPPGSSEREKKWQEVSEEIKKIFKTAVKLLQDKGKMKQGQAKRYLFSAIEDEFDFALGNQTPAFLKKCVCYIRKIANIERFVKIPEMGKYMDLAGAEPRVIRDPEALEKLTRLRDAFVPTIVASSNLRVYTSVTHCDMKLGYSRDVENHYIEGLCKQFYEDMIDIIQATVQQNFDTETDVLYDEILQHTSLCRTYASFFEYQCDALASVHRYILPRKPGPVHPLVIYGGPCTGKTLLLAEVAKKAYSWLHEEMGPESDPVVVVRFLGTTDLSTDLKSLLQSICEQLAANYRRPVQSYPKKPHDLRDLFVNLLNESSLQRPLVLVLDALEQLAESDDARRLWWLPVHLPRSVRVVLSTLPNKHGLLQKLRSLIPTADHYLDLVPGDRRLCSRVLKQQLLRVKRKVTSGQQIYVNEALSCCALPMFVNLTFREVRSWKSHRDVDGSSLGVTVHEGIEQLFRSLEEACGPRLIARALGYLTVAKAGLSEMELEDVLALDDGVMAELRRDGGPSDPLRVPYLHIARLKEGLRGYLIERHVRNVTLLVWANRHLQLVAQKRYLQDEADLREMHAVLADYFLGVWAGGRRKGLGGGGRGGEDPAVAGGSRNSRVMERVEEEEEEEEQFVERAAFDRQAPDQPWVFQCNPLEPDIFFVNHRKMTELSHHLTRCGKTDDLLYGVIMNFSWLYTMIKIGRFDGVLADIDLAYGCSQEKELKFLASTLRGIKGKVTARPGSLSAELQQRLLPVVGSLPKLRHLLLECDRDGPKYCSIVPLHSSVDVAYSPERLPLAASHVHVTEVLPTGRPGTVLAALEDGSISTWDVESRQLLRRITTAQSVVLGMKLSGDERYLVVATAHNTLLIYDHANSRLLSEVEVKGARPGGGTRLINGFALSAHHALAWLEASKAVAVVDLLYGWPLYQFHCWYEVTCVRCSPDGVYAFCGQCLNTTTIFHLGSGEKLSTVTSEFSGGFVQFLLVLDAARELAMVDNEGSLSVWNTEEMSNPRLTDDFDCRRGDGEVVGLELSEDQSAVLICKALGLELLDTGAWKVAEKFRARHGERFACAVLARDGRCIIAAMENTSAVFFWRRDTGQCLANLQEVSGNVVKLVKSSHHDMLLSLSTGGVLSLWDVDLITAVSNVDKTGRPIRRLVLPARGESVYSLDGSEAVHKWHLGHGFVEAVFRHEGAAEHCVLTSAGDLMVSADDRCSQYVWRTGSGENLFRISGQRISQLMLTHNDQFVVSLCEESASRVWRLATGHRVCRILAALRDAFVTAANTFVVGVAENKVLAVSLWTGSITKRFCCEDGASIVDFRPVPDCPDVVAFITSAETVTLWSLTDEVVCRRVQLPGDFLRDLGDFEVSPNGRLAVLSRGDEKIHVLDLHSGKLRVVPASGGVWRQKLSRDGRYLVYVCFRHPEEDEDGDGEGDGGGPSSLVVVRLADGKTIGTCSLYKMPTFLALSQRHLNIIVGFEDGSLGVYTVVDRVDAALKIKIATSNSRQLFGGSTQPARPRRRRHGFKAAADCVWRESTEVFARDSPVPVAHPGEPPEGTPSKRHSHGCDRAGATPDVGTSGFSADE
uniref:NACHT and WD repeat domain containing 2 n=1 Tax=Ornithorhynchus anatinus TaxID=9258 RepID=A0A6I8NWK5_ORNAN